MCIASFLQSDTWLDTEGALPEGAEVTVVPEGSSDVAPHKDASIATIAVGHVDVGGDVLYQLRKDGVLLSEMIPRHRLRHRVWYSICSACVTNEKRHDAPSTQHFLNKILHFFMGHTVDGSNFRFYQRENFIYLVHQSITRTMPHTSKWEDAAFLVTSQIESA